MLQKLYLVPCSTAEGFDKSNFNLGQVQKSKQNGKLNVHRNAANPILDRLQIMSEQFDMHNAYITNWSIPLRLIN